MSTNSSCVVVDGRDAVKCPRCRDDLRGRLIDVESLCAACPRGATITLHFIKTLGGEAKRIDEPGQTYTRRSMTPQEVIDLRPGNVPNLFALAEADGAT